MLARDVLCRDARTSGTCGASSSFFVSFMDTLHPAPLVAVSCGEVAHHQPQNRSGRIWVLAILEGP